MLFFLILFACSGDTSEDTQISESGWVDSGPDITTDHTGDSGRREPGVTYVLDEQLAAQLALLEVPQVPLPPPPAQDPAMVSLGQALFFDPILSGPRDVACSSCHSPVDHTGDGLTLSIGTTTAGPQPFIPRHAPALFNVGDPTVRNLFWDGRVFLEGDQPQTSDLASVPAGLSGVVALQALLPILDRDEMRGQAGQLVDGEACPLCDAITPEDAFEALLQRLRQIDGYQVLFAQAGYMTPDDWTIDIVGNALAAYQTEAFAAVNTPWDRYLAGDLSALTSAQKLGASIFFGGGGCSECHSGPLFTDQAFHNTGVVQLGPGRPATAPLDLGRGEHSGEPTDRFAFRTPGLRNVELTAPYMHNGSQVDLEAVVVHYGAPLLTIPNFDPSVLPMELQDTVQDDQSVQNDVLANLSPDLPTAEALAGLSNVREFMLALTDPSSVDMSTLVPTEVPSGLPIP